MSEGRCETCRWWQRVRQDDGNCTLISHDPESATDSRYRERAQQARAAELRTRSDFGCVLWEADTEGSG